MRIFYPLLIVNQIRYIKPFASKEGVAGLIWPVFMRHGELDLPDDFVFCGGDLMGTGGYRMGAGRPGWHRKTGHMRQIDVRRLARDGLLQRASSFSWVWKDADTGEATASIWMIVEPGCVRFQYRLDRERDVDDRARIITTACNYGGVRHWFACPCCGRRCAVVYLGQRVACRKCYRLQYPSQSDDVTGNSWRKTRKLAARLGADGADWEWKQKPKGMHWATFERIRAKLWEQESVRDAALCAVYHRLMAQLRR